MRLRYHVLLFLALSLLTTVLYLVWYDKHVTPLVIIGMFIVAFPIIAGGHAAIYLANQFFKYKGLHFLLAIPACYLVSVGCNTVLVLLGQLKPEDEITIKDYFYQPLTAWFIPVMFAAEGVRYLIKESRENRQPS